jgi:hypothetical protein
MKMILKGVKTIPKSVKISLMRVKTTLTNMKQKILKDKTLMNLVYTLICENYVKSNKKHTHNPFFGKKSDFFVGKNQISYRKFMIGGHFDSVRHYIFLLIFVFYDLNYQNIAFDQL